ncbi:hypothetical protein CEXT_199561 [Caerostris extrusa]|uniref:Uncharacterized protein n=1 Tax=Caerostris extrusa TaxID=172846 RepID=A0AAV4MTJ3_CAEEX|nr:hypothetical protein CEXT_199561 [Caerostris extrusa]
MRVRFLLAKDKRNASEEFLTPNKKLTAKANFTSTPSDLPRAGYGYSPVTARGREVKALADESRVAVWSNLISFVPSDGSVYCWVTRDFGK